QEASPEAGARLELVDWLLREGPATPAEPRDAALTALQEERKRLEAGIEEPQRVMAMTDGTPEDSHVYIRGSHKSPGDLAPRRFLEAIDHAKQPIARGNSGRLELARRMTAPSDPLLYRVLVNRVWGHHFGEGIVRTPDDFGIRGDRPTHPELLEYLTSEFMRGGGSLKALHRMLVLSSTYQMSSRGDRRAVAADPQNKLLHHMPVRRLEAEAVRDTVLAVSGRLDRKLFGPSVQPHLTPFMEGRGRPAESGPLDGDGRRSIYISVRRNFLTPLFLAFDYPVPFTTIGKRSVSNVPAQALALMNNPFLIDQAGLWAKAILAEPGQTPRQRLTALYERAFTRPPTEAEVTAALAFLEEQDRRYGAANDVRSWADLCHVLMNTKEFIFIN
ncbi:MAG TPA: DUF1553 domain-containing protein, partial [Armatimonadota bacterium]|nr:DUF1553 domain-containing protein [Armatimonadota bacterium]